MASRAIALSFSNARPTYNDDILLDVDVVYMEGGSVFNNPITVQVAIADTLNTVQTKIATAVRANTPAGMTAISANNVWLPTYSKA